MDKEYKVKVTWQAMAQMKEIVQYISVELLSPDAAISRHLSALKEADLIRDEREGKFIYYELNASVLEEIILWISELKEEDDHDQTT